MLRPANNTYVNIVTGRYIYYFNYYVQIIVNNAKGSEFRRVFSADKYGFNRKITPKTTEFHNHVHRIGFTPQLVK